MIAAYVSSHGYGHAVRTLEVLREVRAMDPNEPIVVNGSFPPALATRRIAEPILVRHLECDVGLAQKDALSIDLEATAARCRHFREGFSSLVEREAEWLRAQRPRVVLCDVPPLGFVAAHQAGVPSVGLANFSWDWIYRHYAPSQPDLADAAADAASAYHRATLLLELPFAGDLSAFSKREVIPLVARQPGVERSEVKARLGLGPRTLVLVSFGGLGLPGLAEVPFSDDFEFLMVGQLEGARNLRVLSPLELEAAGLDYVDLVGASSVVVTKPGYGIVSDAIGAGAALVYTDRGDFPEYPILVAGMARVLPAVYVSNTDLMGGRLDGAIASVLGMERPPAPRRDGATQAAKVLLGF